MSALAAGGGREGEVLGATVWAPPSSDGLGRAVAVSVLLHAVAVALVLYIVLSPLSLSSSAPKEEEKTFF